MCTYTLLVPSDYNRGALGRVTFTPGGPDEMTIQLRVLPDGNLEFNETFMLGLQLIGGVMTQVGPRNRAEVTIINDDCKITLFMKKLELMCMLYSCTSVLPRCS